MFTYFVKPSNELEVPQDGSSPDDAALQFLVDHPDLDRVDVTLDPVPSMGQGAKLMHTKTVRRPRA